MSSDEVYEPVGDVRAAGAPESGSAEERIGAARAVLESLADRPLTEHAPAYDGLHEQLQAVLAEIDGA